MDSPTTSLVDAAAASRAAQRAQTRQTSEGRPTSHETMADDVNEDWSMDASDDSQFLSTPSMRLTDFLPLMRLRDTELAGRRPPQEGRRLTNADIIATIEQVLDIVGHVDDPLNPPEEEDEEANPTVSS